MIFNKHMFQKFNHWSQGVGGVWEAYIDVETDASSSAISKTDLYTYDGDAMYNIGGLKELKKTF